MMCGNPQCASPEFTPKDSRRKYCSRSCAGVVNGSLYPKRKRTRDRAAECVGCGGELKPSQTKFCSRTCNGAYRRAATIEAWLSGEWDGSLENGMLSAAVRRHLLALAGDACPLCGWNTPNPVTGRPILTINHVNGRADDNSPGNLEVLCFNCHTLTPTFGFLNNGNGARAVKYTQRAGFAEISGEDA